MYNYYNTDILCIRHRQENNVDNFRQVFSINIIMLRCILKIFQKPLYLTSL